MSKNTQSNSNNGIANLTDLQNVLGVKMEKKTTTTKTLTEKAQVMRQVNEAMHELLITKFPQYYKNIEYIQKIKQIGHFKTQQKSNKNICR